MVKLVFAVYRQFNWCQLLEISRNIEDAKYSYVPLSQKGVLGTYFLQTAYRFFLIGRTAHGKLKHTIKKKKPEKGVSLLHILVC